MRGKAIPKRKIAPDQKYNSVLVAKFINYIMLDGKKVVATKNVYSAMDEFAKQVKGDALENLEKAINNVKPKMEVRSKRVGGANFQVPLPVNPDRQLALALRWIIDAARKGRGSAEFYKSLAKELVDSFNNQGHAIKKKEETHRMAEANKAFSQFA